MGIEGIGSSVVIALAAVLWLVYLIPTWFRRREYLSTERNAVRLQQTLRILAETAEVPETVRAETSARSVAAQQRVLRKEHDRQREIERTAERARSEAAAKTRATLTPTAAVVSSRSTAAQRLRRSRAVTSLVLLLALATAGVGLTPFVAGASTVVVASGAVVAMLALSLLNRMAAVSRERARVASELRAQTAAARAPAAAEPMAVADESEDAGWMPVPLPKPLYLSRPPAQPLVSEAALAAARAEVLAEAERMRRVRAEAERAEKVTPILRPAVASAAPSRFARMGIIEDTDSMVTNLDEVLRRRRAV